MIFVIDLFLYILSSGIFSFAIFSCAAETFRVKTNSLLISGINTSLLKPSKKFLVQAYQVFCFLFCREIISCDHQLSWHYFWAPLVVALEWPVLYFWISQFFSFYFWGEYDDPWRFSLFCSIRVAREEVAADVTESDENELHYCSNFAFVWFPSQNLLIYTQFWKGACVRCSFNSTLSF